MATIVRKQRILNIEVEPDLRNQLPSDDDDEAVLNRLVSQRTSASHLDPSEKTSITMLPVAVNLSDIDIRIVESSNERSIISKDRWHIIVPKAEDHVQENDQTTEQLNLLWRQLTAVSQSLQRHLLTLQKSKFIRQQQHAAERGGAEDKENQAASMEGKKENDYKKPIKSARKNVNEFTGSEDNSEHTDLPFPKPSPVVEIKYASRPSAMMGVVRSEKMEIAKEIFDTDEDDDHCRQPTTDNSIHAISEGPSILVDNDTSESEEREETVKSTKKKKTTKVAPAQTAQAEVMVEEVTDLWALKVLQLKDLCRKRGVNVSGSKAQLVERLAQFINIAQPRGSQMSVDVRASLVRTSVASNATTLPYETEQVPGDNVPILESLPVVDPCIKLSYIPPHLVVPETQEDDDEDDVEEAMTRLSVLQPLKDE